MHAPIKTIIFRILMVLLPFMLFVVLAEIGLRIYLSSHTFYDVEMSRYAGSLKIQSNNPMIGHEHRPNSTLHVMDVDVRINSDGFRDDDYLLERNNKQRIILLGDSLTFAWGVEKKDSFEHLLESRFNLVKPTEIINFGTGNYNTTQEVTLFREKGLKYRPDAVYLFYFINDAEPIPKKSRHAWLGNFRLATFFWSRVKALIALRSPGESFKDYYAKLYLDDQPGWQQTRASFKELQQLCDKNGIALKVVILPELHSLTDYTFKQEHQLLVSYLDSLGIDNLNLAPYFSVETNPSVLWVARDDAHPNAAAHRLIAEYSFPFLSKQDGEK